MSAVDDIKRAIEQLPKPEFWTLSDWLMRKREDDWDRQIEADIHAGQLDKLAESVGHPEDRARDFVGACRGGPRRTARARRSGGDPKAVFPQSQPRSFATQDRQPPACP